MLLGPAVLRSHRLSNFEIEVSYIIIDRLGSTAVFLYNLLVKIALAVLRDRSIVGKGHGRYHKRKKGTLKNCGVALQKPFSWSRGKQREMTARS
jgi:hypothetical protein